MDMEIIDKTQNVSSEENNIEEGIDGLDDFLSYESLGLSNEEVDPNGINIPVDEDNESIKSNKVRKKAEKVEVKPEKEPVVKFEELSEIKDLGIEPEKNVINDGSDYKSIAKALMDSGVWESADTFETPDGEVSFEDLNIDRDTFLQLLKYNQNKAVSDVANNSVSVEGMSEFTKSLINIEKNGGNVAQALQAYQSIKEPLNSIDIESQQGQIDVVMLRLQQNGIVGEDAKDLIESYINKGVLESKAYEFKKQLDDAFDNYIKQQEQKAIDEEKAYRESLKNYKINLKSSLKTFKEFNLSDSYIKKLVDVATTELADGKFEFDTMLDVMRSNPEDAAELLLFVSDKEAYLQAKTKELLNKQNVDTLKKISLIPKGNSNIKIDGRSKGRDAIISFDKLKV